MRMATVQAPPTTTEQRLRVDAVDWPSYLKIGEGFMDRRIRVTYDRGRLELMTVSPQHDGWKSFLGRMLAALCDELGIDFAGFGGMTIQREDLRRGFEPDECYYIQNEPAVRNRL